MKKKTKITIQQASSGNYYTQLSKGYRPDGTRNRIKITAATEEEVYLKAQRWLKGIEEEEICPYTVAEAMKAFIENRSAVLEPTTIRFYNEIIRNKFQCIMHIKLVDLKAQHIQAAINMDSRRLGYKSVKNAYGFLLSVLRANDVNIKLSSIRLPKREVKERKLPSADVIYAMVKGTESELPVLLAMWLSLRIGEVAGLQFQDVDAVHKKLYVRREVVRTDDGWTLTNHCKTMKSTRCVNLPDYIYELIRNIPHAKETDQIITVTPNTIRKRFKNIVLANGLDIRFHDLRHIFASTTCMLNIPEKYAMDMGGWSTPDVYKNIYQETFDSERAKADNAIDDYFNSIIMDKQ